MAKHDRLKENELQFIQEHFDEMSLSELATSLGRNYYTIQKNARKLQLNRIHVWSREEDEILRTLYGKYSAGYIAARVGVGVSSVYNRIRRLRQNGERI